MSEQQLVTVSLDEVQSKLASKEDMYIFLKEHRKGVSK